jgi:hypothetical protein
MNQQVPRIPMLLAAWTLVAVATTGAYAHPGSGIVVDRGGRAYFADTGGGAWIRHERKLRASDPRFHWMAIDEGERPAEPLSLDPRRRSAVAATRPPRIERCSDRGGWRRCAVLHGVPRRTLAAHEVHPIGRTHPGGPLAQRRPGPLDQRSGCRPGRRALLHGRQGRAAHRSPGRRHHPGGERLGARLCLDPRH